MDPRDAELFGVTLYIAAAVALGATILILIRLVTRWLKTAKPAPHKYETYECGVPQIGSTRERFSVKFYLVALLFVLFDIETVFLVPYAVTYKHLGMQGFYGVLAFIVILGIGLL